MRDSKAHNTANHQKWEPAHWPPDCSTGSDGPGWTRHAKHWSEPCFADRKYKISIYMANHCRSVTKLCPILCDPTDYRTPGFSVLHCLPEILKLMSIELVTPSNLLILCYPLLLLPSIFPSIRVFSNRHIKRHSTSLIIGLVAQLRSTLSDFMDYSQDPLSMRFSKQEYWIGLLCPPPGDLFDPGIKLASLMFPALAGGFFTTSATWKAPSLIIRQIQIKTTMQYHFTLTRMTIIKNSTNN